MKTIAIASNGMDVLYVVTIAVVAVLSVLLWYLPIHVAKLRRHSKLASIVVLTVCSLFVGITWIVAIVWAFTEDNRGASPARAGTSRPLRAFPVVNQNYDAAELADNYDGPGRYEVVGVDRATKMDTTWVVNASNKSNARVKAELEGIVITSIRFSG